MVGSAATMVSLAPPTSGLAGWVIGLSFLGLLLLGCRQPFIWP
jgi:hypothetical protein